MKPQRPSARPQGAPDSEAPPSVGRYDQEFLYHLYRGSELLQDNSVDEAKAELERALKLQPRDVEGQGLLGIVYFRLGMYPRAIDIYEQLERAVPLEITPKINLALCYLKTGLTERAKDKLEQLLEQAPNHKRAWGYLGLVYQRFGDFEKARVAFERADRPKLAARMAALITDATEAALADIPELAPQHATSSSAPVSFRPSLMPSMPPAGQLPRHLGTLPPSGGPGVAPPLPIQRLAREAELVFPEHPRVVVHPSGCVLARIETSLALRPAWVSALCNDAAPFATSSLRRARRGHGSSALLGGSDAPIVSVIGTGRAVLAPRPGQTLWIAEVDDEPSHVVESRLVAFESGIEYEAGALEPRHESAPIVVRLSGKGSVVAWCRGPLLSLAVANDHPALVHSDRVVGWTGRVLARLVAPIEAPAGLSAMVGFSGQGAVLLDLGITGDPRTAPDPTTALDLGATPTLSAPVP